jgi:hypothetical protein
MTIEEQVTTQLNALLGKLSVSNINLALPAQIGDPAVVRLVDLPTELQITSLIPTTLSLSWITKDVMMKVNDELPPNIQSDLQQGKQIDLGKVNIDDLVQGPKPVPLGDQLEIPSGIPGIVGQLVGTIQTPASTTLPVTVSAKWSVTDEQGRTLDQTQCSPPSASTVEAAFVFAPQLIPLIEPLPPPTVRKITVEVSLSVKLPVSIDQPAGGGASPGGQVITVPKPETPFRLSVTVPVPALPIPRILALFNHVDFDLSVHGGTPAQILVIVRPEEPFRELGTIANALNALSATLGKLGSAFGSVMSGVDLALTLTGVGRLASLLGAANQSNGVYVIVRASNAESHLDKINFPVTGAPLGTPTNANDQFGSLVLMGPQSTWVRFYNAYEFSTSEGMFELSFAPIPPGGAGTPASPPSFVANVAAAVMSSLVGDPPDCVPPEAIVVLARSTDKTFNDKMSSLQFLP